jgi:RNA polymerase sigma-70 factor (ECF subfamily)
MNPAADPEYLGRLLAEQGSTLALYARQWTDAADDCVQEALVELVCQPVLPANVAAWLFRVVRNRAISRARASNRRRRHETQAASERPLVDATKETAEWSADEVTAALEHLSADLREIVVLRVWGNQTYDSIAELMSISPSTAHRRYELALQAIRERLGLTWTAPKATRLNSNP